MNEEEYIMKYIQALLVALITSLSGAVCAEEIEWSLAQDETAERIALAAAEEKAFEWENSMLLAAADPCADYYINRFRNEGNFGEDGSDRGQEAGII